MQKYCYKIVKDQQNVLLFGVFFFLAWLLHVFGPLLPLFFCKLCKPIISTVLGLDEAVHCCQNEEAAQWNIFRFSTFQDESLNVEKRPKNGLNLKNRGNVSLCANVDDLGPLHSCFGNMVTINGAQFGPVFLDHWAWFSALVAVLRLACKWWWYSRKHRPKLKWVAPRPPTFRLRQASTDPLNGMKNGDFHTLTNMEFRNMSNKAV